MKKALCLIMLALFVGGVLGCKGDKPADPKKPVEKPVEKPAEK